MGGKGGKGVGGVFVL